MSKIGRDRRNLHKTNPSSQWRLIKAEWVDAWIEWKRKIKAGIEYIKYRRMMKPNN